MNYQINILVLFWGSQIVCHEQALLYKQEKSYLKCENMSTYDSGTWQMRRKGWTIP